EQGRDAEPRAANDGVGRLPPQGADDDLRSFAYGALVDLRRLFRIRPEIVDDDFWPFRVRCCRVHRQEPVAHRLRRDGIIRSERQRQGDTLDMADEGRRAERQTVEERPAGRMIGIAATPLSERLRDGGRVSGVVLHRERELEPAGENGIGRGAKFGAQLIARRRFEYAPQQLLVFCHGVARDVALALNVLAHRLNRMTKLELRLSAHLVNARKDGRTQIWRARRFIEKNQRALRGSLGKRQARLQYALLCGERGIEAGDRDFIQPSACALYLPALDERFDRIQQVLLL